MKFGISTRLVGYLVNKTLRTTRRKKIEKNLHSFIKSWFFGKQQSRPFKKNSK